MTLSQECGIFSKLQCVLAFLTFPFEVIPMLVDSTKVSSVTTVKTPMAATQFCEHCEIVEFKVGLENVLFINDSCGDETGSWSSDDQSEMLLFDYGISFEYSLLLCTVSVVYATLYIMIFVLVPIVA